MAVQPNHALAAGVSHDYMSTACHHHLHFRCRQTCKFCDAPCQCGCHPIPCEHCHGTGRAPSSDGRTPCGFCTGGTTTRRTDT